MNKKVKEFIDEYEEYFKDDIAAIDAELEKSEGYSEIIDAEIKNLKGNGAFGTTKGGQHYLIEHLSNAVQLQSQRQSLRKDKFSIKKLILEYAIKAEKGENGATDDIAAAINQYIENSKKKDQNKDITILDDDLDSEIDNAIERGNDCL